MGGATFPAAVKLNLRDRCALHTLIINAAECEPYLTCDDRLLRESAEEVADGAGIMARAIGVDRIIVAIESSEPEAAAMRRHNIGMGYPLEVRMVPAQYPMHAAHRHLHPPPHLRPHPLGQAAVARASRCRSERSHERRAPHPVPAARRAAERRRRQPRGPARGVFAGDRADPRRVGRADQPRHRGPCHRGPLRLAVAGRDGVLLGVRVLSHAETPGLGDKIELAKSDWIEGFTGHSLTDPAPEGWKVRKDGGVFDQFSDATITPRAVVGTVHRGLAFFARNRDALLAAKETG